MFGVKDSGAQALRLDVVRVPAEQSLPEYLNSGWIENIEPKNVEEMTVGGFPATSATARGDQWRKMAVADRPAERFRVLNGLGPDDRVKPGDLVKVVVE